MLARSRLVGKLDKRHEKLFSTLSEPFAEQDLVFLRHKNPSKPPILTKPLRSGRQIDSHRGTIPHDGLIGLRSRDQVSTSKGHKLQAYHPSLEEYVILTPRLVTPVYPSYAALITSLLDIHITPKSQNIQVLEAGTGHGSLTLHLARALQAGNNSITPEVQEELRHLKPTKPSEEISTPHLDKYKLFRSAILHTLDVSEKHSLHARGIVKGFRRGMYFPTVDFHVGNLSDFLKSQLQPSQTPSQDHSPSPSSDSVTKSSSFFSSSSEHFAHVILDLPSVHTHLALVAQSLQAAGSVVVFTPSITQLTDCIRAIREQNVPLVLERVLEVGTGLSGGREWDLREVKIRAKSQIVKETQVEDTTTTQGEEVESQDGGEQTEDAATVDPTLADAVEEGKLEMVCRPKVGVKVAGGGFIGVWRKLRSRPQKQDVE